MGLGKRNAYGSDYGSKRVSVSKSGHGFHPKTWMATARHESSVDGQSSTTSHTARTARGAYNKAARFLRGR